MKSYIRDKKAFLGRSGISGYIYSAEGSLVTLKNCALNEVTDYTIQANGTISKPTHNILETPRGASYTSRGLTFSTDLNGAISISGALDDYKNGNYGSEIPMGYVFVGENTIKTGNLYTPHITSGDYMLSMEVSGEGASYVQLAWFIYDTSGARIAIISNFESAHRYFYEGYKSGVRIGVTKCIGVPINITVKIVLQKVAGDGTTSAIYKPFGHETTIIDGSYTHRIFTKSPVTYGSLISYSDQAITYASGDVEKIIVPTLPCNKGGDTTLAVDSDAKINVTYFSNGG